MQRYAVWFGGSMLASTVSTVGACFGFGFWLCIKVAVTILFL
jgi:hypothetical protein